MTRRFDDAERRARIGLRHRLSQPSATVEEVAGDLVGLHSSDPVTVYLSARSRVAGFRSADLDDALYDRRTLVRVLGMRRTMFVVPIDLAAVVDAACTQALEPAERRRLIRLIEDQGHTTEGDRWLRQIEAAVMDSLRRRGEATATELREDVEALSLRISFGEGREWAGTMGLSTRVLFLLATGGRIVRARPKGTWRSSLYRWAPMSDWLGYELPDLDPGDARRELTRRWLHSFGPGTLVDLKWWTGWTVAETRTALEAAGAIEVQVGGGPGYVGSDDLDPVAAPPPWVAFLPGLDPTTMGWKERDWYMGDHAALLFDRNGNAGPTIWWDGRVVGGWAQRDDGEVAYRLLTDVGGDPAAAIAEEAGRVEAWLGDDRIRTRFTGPLEKELRS